MDDNGKLISNDVTTVADFEKMGQKGYCTTHLSFGDKDDCHGYLVGEENNGLNYMFLMMNGARIAVGRGASAIACTNLFKKIGVKNENVIMCDRKGIIYKGRSQVDQFKSAHAVETKLRTLEQLSLIHI